MKKLESTNLIEDMKRLLQSKLAGEIRLTEEPIKPELLMQEMKHPSCGAVVSFEGWVRDFNEGKVVTQLQYEAYPELVKHEAQAIFNEAIEKFSCRSLLVVHRTGSLSIEEIAVWVGATSIHRKAAFQACEYVIDELKVRLPIWKKEFYANADSGWVNCQACSSYVSETLDFKHQDSKHRVLNHVKAREAEANISKS